MHRKNHETNQILESDVGPFYLHSLPCWYKLSARLSHLTHLVLHTICDCFFPKFFLLSINDHQVLRHHHQRVYLLHFCVFLRSFKIFIYINNIFIINSIDNIFKYVNINMGINGIIPLIWWFGIVYELVYYIGCDKKIEMLLVE